MDLLPSPDQEALVASAAMFLAKEMPMKLIRGLLDQPSTRHPGSWAACAALGWFGLGLDAASGGIGCGLADEALLFREIGRHLAPGPFLATTLGARLACRCGQGKLVADILEGSVVVGLAEPQHGGAVFDTSSAASPSRVTAELRLFDVVDADLVIVLTGEGAALVEVDRLSERESVMCIDEATRLAKARAMGVSAMAYLPSSAEDLFSRATVLAAAVLCGIAEATRDDAAEYAKIRVQYGKPIGAHQAVKHTCAEMAVRAEAATSQLLFAALSADDRQVDAAYHASAAKVVASDAALKNAGANIQVHGGVGFTYEHPAHLYLKRAHVFDQILGGSRHHLALVLGANPPS